MADFETLTRQMTSLMRMLDDLFIQRNLRVTVAHGRVRWNGIIQHIEVLSSDDRWVIWHAVISTDLLQPWVLNVVLENAPDLLELTTQEQMNRVDEMEQAIVAIGPWLTQQHQAVSNDSD